jgi:hypothetical protein
MPNADFERLTGSKLGIRFAAAHAEVGDLIVLVENGSILIELPALDHMHSHFDDPGQLDVELVDNAIQFVSDMLNDRYLITTATSDDRQVWASFQHRDHSDTADESSPDMLGQTLRHYLWSGPPQV